MPQSVKKNAEERMEKAILSLKRDLATVAGRTCFDVTAGSHSSGVLRCSDSS